MRLHTLIITLLTSLALIACGGQGGKGGKAPSAYQELSSVSETLQNKLNETAAPITNTDAMITRFSELPKTLKLSADDYKEFVIYALRGEFKAPEGASAEVTKELTTFSKDLKAYKDSLMATPDNAQVLVAEIASSLVKVPTLVTKIEGEAQMVKANPLASKAEKAKASKQSSEAKALADKTTNDVKTIQEEAKTLPGNAKDAVAKFMSALKSVGIDNLDAAKSAPTDTVKGAVKDAKEAGEQVVETAKDSAEASVEAAKSAAE